MLQAFATLILGARGRSNIFQHHTAFARCLAVSILFQGGPGIGSTKRIQNRFRLEGAPAALKKRSKTGPPPSSSWPKYRERFPFGPNTKSLGDHIGVPHVVAPRSIPAPPRSD